MDAETRPATPFTRPVIPGPGTRLADRYELVQVIGRGGRGVVFRANDPVLGREVAVKLVPAAHNDPAAEARFQREAHVVARMDHPHIVPIYDFGSHHQTLFYVMPLLSGGSLRRRLADGELSLGDAVEVGAQVASALDYSHSQGIVHRDIKPENILYAKEAGVLRVRVTDFGLAHDRAARRLTETHHLPGTLAYLSPEQVSGPDIDGRADLYALGVVLFECLVGAPPFEGAPFSVLYRIVHEPAEPVARRCAGLDEDLAALVDLCLFKDRQRRPASGRDVELRLRAIHERLDAQERERTLEPVVRDHTAPREAAMVGRDEEARRMHDHLDRSLEGCCQLVLVAGDAGTGKSRLLQELEGWALVRGVRVLRGHFSADDRTFPYQGFCELIQDYFRSRRAMSGGSSTSDHGWRAAAGERIRDPSRAAARPGPDFRDLAQELVDLFPQLTEVPELRAAVADRPAVASHHDIQERIGATRIFEVIARTLARLGEGKPLVLLLESLHHGEVAVAALRYLVPRLAAMPTLVVATYRPAEVDRHHPLADLVRQFSDDPRFALIEVANLQRDAFAALIRRLVGSEALSDSAVDRLFEATEGNPLFACELVASLRESGELSRDPSGLWRLTADVGVLSHGLPTTLHQAAESRLSRLEPADRELLAKASVLGRSFDVDDLSAVIQGGDSFDRSLERLLHAGLLEEDATSRGDRVRFCSGAVRELLYRGLSRRRRRAQHLACARQLETRHRGRAERVLPQLVHHFSRADQAPETVRYALELARRSLDVYSPEDALQATRTALEWVDDESVPDAGVAEAELLFVGARALRSMGDLDGALRRAETACELFAQHGSPGQAAAVALMVAEATWQARRMDEARAWVDWGAELARSAASPTLGRLLTLGATLANLRGESARARAYLDEVESLPSFEPDRGDRPIPTGGELRVALTHPVGELVPGSLETDEAAEVAANVFETLLVAEDEGRLRPGLCREWRSSPDARVFRLHLEPEACFSDGSPVTAQGVKASLEASARAGFGTLSPGFFDVIEGMAEWLRGSAGISDVTGLRRIDASTLEVRLTEPLPMFPVLLSDSRTAIAREAKGESGGSTWLGTGPFVIAQRSDDEVILEPNDRSWRSRAGRRGPRLDRLVFHTGYRSSQIAAALRAGEVDLGRDLLPEDLDDLLRRPRWRSGLVETTRKNVYFVLFQPGGPTSRHAGVRRALTGLLWPQDLVWRTLGRFAHPAVSLVPPGVLGHDPGRHHERLHRTRARILLEGADLAFPIQLRAAIHPVLQDRYSALLEALFAEWRSLGVDVDVLTPDMRSFLRAYQQNTDLDLLVGRWNADYDDPDNFTYNLLHSRAGILRCWVPGGACGEHGAVASDDSWAECDALMERARHEADPAVRVAIYRRFEDAMYRRHILRPLFHDVDYRLASPRVRGVSLGTTYPCVDYANLGIVDEASALDAEGDESADSASRAGVLNVPISGTVSSLDPADATSVESLEVVGNVFETLTRLDRSARIVPWLAASLEAEDGGRRYRFRLRPGLRFQDGRPCTSRDVRHSFERLLRRRGAESHFVLLPIRGARELSRGDADHLDGLELVSTHELAVELEEPVAFFPALLAHPLAAVVPEGVESFDQTWNLGTVGTGPFRVVRFEPGSRVELEHNPYYWRRNLPKAESLVFHLDMSPDQIVSEFEAGRLTLASDVLPDDVDLLCRRKPPPQYREHPRLSTCFLVLDNREGPFVDRELRRALARAVDVNSIQASTLGARVSRAHGLLPPGMLGYDARRRAPDIDRAAAERLRGLRLDVRPHSSYLGALSPFWKRWCEEIRRLGVDLRHEDRAIDNAAKATDVHAGGDVAAFRWIADYPDADAFTLALDFCASRGLFDPSPFPELARLARQGRHETDPALRHAIYRELEDILARECLIVPLFHEQAYRLAQTSVRGLRLDLSFPEVRYEELYFDG